MKQLLALITACAVSAGAAINPTALEKDLQQLAAGFKGRLGIYVRDATGAEAAVNRDQRFSLQSVVKMITAAAVLDRGWKLNDSVTIRKQDLSLYVQPVGEIVLKKGRYDTTIADLILRAVTESDSTANDVLMDKLGGPQQVDAFLKKLKIDGMRVDRDERHLQTEIVGLNWDVKYVDPPTLDKAIAAVPKAKREAAYSAYMRDVRDTSTPAAMGDFLNKLLRNQLLQPAAGDHLKKIMLQTATGADRLKAGLAPGWKLGHKTGTSGGWNGITAATNDVGFMISPKGEQIVVVVFVADSPETADARAALISKVSSAVIRHHSER